MTDSVNTRQTEALERQAAAQERIADALEGCPTLDMKERAVFDAALRWHGEGTSRASRNLREAIGNLPARKAPKEK